MEQTLTHNRSSPLSGGHPLTLVLRWFLSLFSFAASSISGALLVCSVEFPQLSKLQGKCSLMAEQAARFIEAV